MSGITQGYTDANIAIFGLSAKIKADFVGGAGADKVVRVLKDFNDPNDFNDFNAPDAIKKNRRKILRGGNFAIFVSLKTFLSGRDIFGSFCTGTDAFAKQTTFLISRVQSRTCSAMPRREKEERKFNLFVESSAEPNLFVLCRGGKRYIQTNLKTYNYREKAIVLRSRTAGVCARHRARIRRLGRLRTTRIRR